MASMSFRCPLRLSRVRLEIVNRPICISIIVAVLLITAHRLPAPISEIPEATPTPKPKREAVKPKPEAIPKPKASSTHLFAGTWTGAMTYTDHGHIKSYFCQIKISDDEKTVWINMSKEGKKEATEPGGQALCSRSGETLTWNLSDSISGLRATWTDTLKISGNGNANFVRDGNWSDGTTFHQNGILSRANASSASIPRTNTLTPQISQLPTARPVPGKPGVVFSPFSSDKYIDVEGFPSGTEVNDPYSGQPFIVP